MFHTSNLTTSRFHEQHSGTMIKSLHRSLCMSLSVLCVFVISSCGGGGGDTSQGAAGAAGDPVKGEMIIVWELSDPEGLNPIVTNDASANAIFNRVYEKLLDLDFKTTEMIPQLAESRPTISADHLTYTFKLFPNAKFSDGKPLTSSDVVFSFKVVKNPLIIDAAALRNYYLDIKDVKALDARTIEVTMTQPYFLAEFQLGSLWILPKHIFDPNGLTDKYTFAQTNDVAAAQASKPMAEFAKWYNTSEVKKDVKLNVGSGPYVFDEWRTNESVTLKRSTSWWNEGKDPWNPGYAKRIMYKVINDRSAAVIALKNSEIDFMESLPQIKFEEEIDTVRTPYLVKAPYEGQIYTYIGWNTQRPALSDKRVRQALSHLVDRDQLMKQIIRGLAKPINSPLYPQSKEYDPSIKGIAFSPTEAKRILDEAGWIDTDNDGYRDKVLDGKKTTLGFKFLLNAGNEAREQIALIVVDECRKVGIQADVKKLEWSVFLENLRTRNFDAYIGSWVNDPIPSDPYQIWHSSQAENKGSNYVSFRNKRADELLELNRIEFDFEKRKQYMYEFQHIVVDEQPYTFLWSPLFPAVYNKRLQNVTFSLVRPGYYPSQWWVPKASWKYEAAQ